MKLLRTQRPPAGPSGGAALLLSFLVLMVIIAIVYQLNRVTSTDQQVARKDLTRIQMELAIESAMLEVFQQLLQDGELRQGAESGAGDGAGADGAAPPNAGGADGPESTPDAADSKMDEWAQVASTSINNLSLRILIQDEDSKYNILNMLAEDEEEAQDAHDRVVRILDLCREDTLADISGPDADAMANVMREHMLRRNDSLLPRPPHQLNDDEEDINRGIPLTMREFVVLEPFIENHFRDFFDRDGTRVHSITSYLTIYTAPFTEGGDGAEALSAGGGFAVNVNTAPLAVLTGLMDGRDVDTRLWEQVLEYRNLEEDLGPDAEEVDPIYDEFGEELLQRRIFDTLEELTEVRDWEDLDPEVRTLVESLLTVESNVFSIFITARRVTADERNQIFDFVSRLEQEEYERSGVHMVHTVRAVVWRQMTDDGVTIVPLVRWEVLDFAPLPVLDYPDDY